METYRNHMECRARLPIDRKAERFEDRRYNCLDEVQPEHLEELRKGKSWRLDVIHGQVVVVTVVPPAWAGGALVLQGVVHVPGKAW